MRGIIDINTMIDWTYQLVDLWSPGLLLERALLANRQLIRALQTRDGVTLLIRVQARRRAPVLLNIERQRVHNTRSRVVTHFVVNCIFLDVDGWIALEEPVSILLIQLCILYGFLKVISHPHIIIIISALLCINIFGKIDRHQNAWVDFAYAVVHPIRGHAHPLLHAPPTKWLGEIHYIYIISINY